MGARVKSRTSKVKPSVRGSAPVHPDHGKELKRLNRIIGQLEGVRRMVEDRRYCHDILMQTRAATSAIKAFETQVLECHLRHCVTTAVLSKRPAERDEKIKELVDLFAGRIGKKI